MTAIPQSAAIAMLPLEDSVVVKLSGEIDLSVSDVADIVVETISHLEDERVVVDMNETTSSVAQH